MKKINEIKNDMLKNQAERKARREERRANREPIDKKTLCIIGLESLGVLLGIYNGYNIHCMAKNGVQVYIDPMPDANTPVEEIPFNI